MTKLVAVHRNSEGGNLRVRLSFEDNSHEDQGKYQVTRDETFTYCTKTLPHTGGLHVFEVRPRRGSFFSYKLILVLGNRDQDDSIVTHYMEAVTIRFSEDREIKVNREYRQSAARFTVNDCYSWFYIPLEGVHTTGGSIFSIAQLTVQRIMKRHNENSRRYPIKQNDSLVEVIDRIFHQLHPSTSLIISDSAKRDLRPANLRNRAASMGLLWELSPSGIWRSLL